MQVFLSYRRSDSAFAAQRQLIDDASHELRTPLAIIRANLDATLAVPGAKAWLLDRKIVVNEVGLGLVDETRAFALQALERRLKVIGLAAVA